MTAAQARQEIVNGAIPGVRGPGSNSISMADGRQFYVGSLGDDLLERYDREGNLIERVPACNLEGEAYINGWACDESGVYTH